MRSTAAQQRLYSLCMLWSGMMAMLCTCVKMDQRLPSTSDCLEDPQAQTLPSLGRMVCPLRFAQRLPCKCASLCLLHKGKSCLEEHVVTFANGLACYRLGFKSLLQI